MMWKYFSDDVTRFVHLLLIFEIIPISGFIFSLAQNLSLYLYVPKIKNEILRAIPYKDFTSGNHLGSVGLIFNIQRKCNKVFLK